METNPFKAIVLDLDGVITDTREAHFRAWEKLFNKFLQDRSIEENFTEIDYETCVDGKPRREGIKSFLASRNIQMRDEEVEILGREKNLIFRSLLEAKPPRPFPEVMRALKLWKSNGIPLAIASSSENCQFLLQKLGLENFFDACVDGTVGKALGLKGKPGPDYFLEAARELGVLQSECAVVEDSPSGVKAGKVGNFMRVYGITREGQTSPETLWASGADAVITSLTEIGYPPNVLDHWEDFLKRVGEREVALFLNFDEALAESVHDPEDARLLPELAPILKHLAEAFKVAIVSDRDRFDLKKRVHVNNLFFIGHHGFEMSGPGCFHYKVQGLETPLCHLEEATLRASDVLDNPKGIVLERKPFGTAVHYRMTDSKDRAKVEAKVKELVATYPDLTIKEGNQVYEILPSLEWGKGKAILKLIEILNLEGPHVLPIYIGDDKADEDPFRVLQGKGIGIRVEGDSSKPTSADFVIRDPPEVLAFLQRISKTFSGREKRWRQHH